jgi:hypothetical protein
LRDANYIIAFKQAPKPEIQFEQRKPFIKQKPQIIEYFKVYPDVYNSESETWPPSLCRWWYGLGSYEKVKTIITDLRKYYSKDEYLLKASNWLEDIIAKYDDIEFVYNSKLEV